MKKILFSLLLFAAGSLLFQNKLKAQSNYSASSVLRHIVMITFKPDAPADSIKALDNLYQSLSKNPMVKDFEMGVNMSTRDTGVIKHVYVTTFTSADDISIYKKVPQYKELFKISLNISQDVQVADYWAKK